jgi:hypothetical protein
MRKLLRRGVRGFLWIIKGLLLLIAVGVLVLWPMSRGRELFTRIARFNGGDQGMEFSVRLIGCGDGRCVFVHRWGRATSGPFLEVVEYQASLRGAGWRWTFESSDMAGFDSMLPSALGPFRWGYGETLTTANEDNLRATSVPAWMVSLVTAAWPVGSIILLIRRRRRRRRLELLGCCSHCAYDLRATADRGGPLLARCPECGAETALRVSGVEQSASGLNSPAEDKAGGLS